MGWVRKNITRYDGWAVRRSSKGHSYKLCPYSTEYREKFKYEGEVCIGFDALDRPIYQLGIWVVGNSTSSNFYQADYFTYVSTEHTTTSGGMLQKDNPPGWICKDPACYYHTTVASGCWYEEV